MTCYPEPRPVGRTEKTQRSRYTRAEGSSLPLLAGYFTAVKITREDVKNPVLMAPDLALCTG
jgi:hypothetical protein